MSHEIKPGESFSFAGFPNFPVAEPVLLEARQVSRLWCKACYFFKDNECFDFDGKYECDGHFRADKKNVYFAPVGSPVPADD